MSQSTNIQEYKGDWIEYGDHRISFRSTTSGNPHTASINIVGTLPSVTFTIGDKIRLKQGGDYKYFYVIRVNDSTSSIDILGDRSDNLANDIITDFAFSKLNTPVGFPSSFTVRVDVSVSAGSTISISTLDVEVIMQGSLVRFIKQLEATISVATANVVYVKLPIERDQADVNPTGNFKAWYCNDSGTQTIGYPIFEEPFLGPANTIGIYKWDATPWSISGGQTLYLNLDYDYIIS